MSDEVGRWTDATMAVLARHSQDLGAVGTPEDLARAVEKTITAAILEQRATLWSGLLGKQVLYPHPSGVAFWIRLGDGISMYAIRADRDDAGGEAGIRRALEQCPQVGAAARDQDDDPEHVAEPTDRPPDAGRSTAGRAARRTGWPARAPC